MPETSLQPYLNPLYWDGHTLGHGSADLYTDPSVGRGDARFAREALKAQPYDEDLVRLHTFYAGDTFDPAEYRPGTVVLCRQERLNGDALTAEEIAAAQQHPVPLHGTETTPSYGPDAAKQLITAGLDGTVPARTYSDMVAWGVVSRDGRGTVQVDGVHAIANDTGLYVPKYALSYRQGPITIGETDHQTKAGTPAWDAISRVTIAHIVAYGKAERSRKTFFGFMGRTVISGASS